jgi:hypothetical protein
MKRSLVFLNRKDLEDLKEQNTRKTREHFRVFRGSNAK